MKQILIRKDFYKSIVLCPSRVFIDTLKRIKQCVSLLKQSQVASKEACINGYDKFYLEYYLSRNTFWYMTVSPTDLGKIFPNIDLSIPVIDISSDKESEWVRSAKELIGNNGNFGVSPNHYLTIKWNSDKLFLSDEAYKGEKPIYIPDVDITDMLDMDFINYSERSIT